MLDILCLISCGTGIKIGLFFSSKRGTIRGYSSRSELFSKFTALRIPSHSPIVAVLSEIALLRRLKCHTCENLYLGWHEPTRYSVIGSVFYLFRLVDICNKMLKYKLLSADISCKRSFMFNCHELYSGVDEA